MVTALLGLAALGCGAAIVASGRRDATQPVRVRVEEVDQPAAKRVGAARHCK